jgi:predicted 3-demethylubiquinone-9 3-methyltransferase (glyoxalase superfamily)
MQKIVTNLWFDTEAEEAAEFYVSVFPNSRILGKAHYTDAGPREAGSVMVVDWELEGQRFTGINGGPEFTFSEAISLLVECEDQAEIDYYWEKLREGGGEESQCGWLKDRFGLSWQVVPKGIDDLLGGEDGERSARAMRAMFEMKKIDVAALQAAADGA